MNFARTRIALHANALQCNCFQWAINEIESKNSAYRVTKCNPHAIQTIPVGNQCSARNLSCKLFEFALETCAGHPWASICVFSVKCGLSLNICKNEAISSSGSERVVGTPILAQCVTTKLKQRQKSENIQSF